jgi:hypothetical protein
MSGQAPYRHTAFLNSTGTVLAKIPLHAVEAESSKRRENHEGVRRCDIVADANQTVS